MLVSLYQAILERGPLFLTSFLDDISEQGVEQLVRLLFLYLLWLF